MDWLIYHLHIIYMHDACKADHLVGCKPFLEILNSLILSSRGFTSIMKVLQVS